MAIGYSLDKKIGDAAWDTASPFFWSPSSPPVTNRDQEVMFYHHPYLLPHSGVSNQGATWMPYPALLIFYQFPGYLEPVNALIEEDSCVKST